MKFATASVAHGGLPSLGLSRGSLNEAQKTWRATLARELYGPFPPQPDSMELERRGIPGEDADYLRLKLRIGTTRLDVDAAMWLPQGSDGPFPLVCGLDFIGPAGIMTTGGFPLDPDAVVLPRPDLGSPRGRLTETMRGVSQHRWPIRQIRRKGYAVLVSCYGSWLPDDPVYVQASKLKLLSQQSGAISAWAWAISRLIDAANVVEEIDETRVAIAGHSRLGKAALWAAANDERIGRVFANASGAAGAAPAVHPVGETLTELRSTFPHWLVAERPMETTVDQHMLLAAIAPRSVYLGNARDDLWADPMGTYHALRAAAAAWEQEDDWPDPQSVWEAGGQVQRGALGYHLRDGGHEMLPYDWQMALDFASA